METKKINEVYLMECVVKRRMWNGKQWHYDFEPTSKYVVQIEDCAYWFAVCKKNNSIKQIKEDQLSDCAPKKNCQHIFHPSVGEVIFLTFDGKGKLVGF